jgi:hypothetical protein
VRAALEAQYQGPSYKQEQWVNIHGYREMPWDFLVTLWFQFNTLLAALVERIPPEKFAALCTIGDGEPAFLGLRH